MHRSGRADARSRMVMVIALLLLAAAPTLAPAAAGIAQPVAQAQVIPGVPELRMTIPAPLASRFRTTKQAANVQLLAQTYLVRDGIPYIRTRGLEFPLIPVAKMVFRPTARQIETSHQLPTAVTKYRDFILHRPIHIPEPPPDVVDRRSLQTPIKNQNPRGTCYAFASIAGLESGYGGGSLDLSENYANYWFMKRDGRGCQESSVGAYEWGQVLYQHGVCTEAICPYLKAPYPTYCNNGGDPAPAKRAGASAHSPYRIKTYQSIWRDESVGDSGLWINNPYYLRSLLAAGKDVVVGLFVAGWNDTNMANVVDVQLAPDGNPLPSSGGHVMLFVGYDDPHQYFIVKNSWGADRGHAGYLYLTYDYVRTYAQLGYVITEVQPVISMAPARIMGIPRAGGSSE